MSKLPITVIGLSILGSLLLWTVTVDAQLTSDTPENLIKAYITAVKNNDQLAMSEIVPRIEQSNKAINYMKRHHKDYFLHYEHKLLELKIKRLRGRRADDLITPIPEARPKRGRTQREQINDVKPSQLNQRRAPNKVTERNANQNRPKNTLDRVRRDASRSRPTNQERIRNRRRAR